MNASKIPAWPLVGMALLVFLVLAPEAAAGQPGPTGYIVGGNLVITSTADYGNASVPMYVPTPGYYVYTTPPPRPYVGPYGPYRPPPYGYWGGRGFGWQPARPFQVHPYWPRRHFHPWFGFGFHGPHGQFFFHGR